MPPPSPVPSLPAVAVAVGAGVGLAAGFAAVPPFHLLTHEYAQVSACIGAIALLLYARKAAARADTTPSGVGSGDALVARGWLLGLAFGAGGFGFHAAVDPSRGCRVEPGAVFFWVTWLPMAAIAVAAGTAAGLRAWRARKLLLVSAAVWGAGIAQAALQSLTGRRMVEPFVGSPLLFDQRAGMALDGLQYVERAWLFVAAAALWAVGRRGGGRAVWAPVLLLVATTLLAPSWFGLGFGRGAAYAALDGERRTAHFELRYPTGGLAALYVETIAREAEWQRHLLAEDWDVPDRTILLLVAEDGAQLRELSGIEAAHAWYGGFAVPWWQGLTSTLRHELVHVVHGLSHPNLVATVDRATTEGTAMAWEDDLVTLPSEHATAAAALRAGALPSAAELLHPLAFWTLDESAAYVASGSLMGFLARRYGPEAFGRYLSTMRLSAFGADSATIDAEWRAFLETVPVDAEAAGAARRLFDETYSPPYTAQRCPKVGAIEEEPLDLAARRWRRADLRGAAELYGRVFAATGEADFAAWAGQALAQAGDGDEALAWVERARGGAGDVAPDVAERLADTELEALLLTGRAAEVATRGEAWPPSPTRAAVERLLARSGDAVAARGLALAEVLLAPVGPVRSAALARLEASAPDDPDLAILDVVSDPSLAGTVGPLGLSYGERAAAFAGLAKVRDLPDVCGDVVAAVASGGRRAAQLGETDLAGAYADTLEACAAARPEDAPRAAFDAARLRERLAWEADAWPLVAQAPTR